MEYTYIPSTKPKEMKWKQLFSTLCNKREQRSILVTEEETRLKKVCDVFIMTTKFTACFMQHKSQLESLLETSPSVNARE